MSMTPDEPVPPREYVGLRPLPQLIFSSRWLQLPLYLGLIVAQGVYVILFVKELWHLVLGAFKFHRAGDHAGRARPDRRGDDLEPADDGDRRRLRNLRVAAASWSAIPTSRNG